MQHQLETHVTGIHMEKRMEERSVCPVRAFMC